VTAFARFMLYPKRLASILACRFGLRRRVGVSGVRGVGQFDKWKPAWFTPLPGEILNRIVAAAHEALQIASGLSGQLCI